MRPSNTRRHCESRTFAGTAAAAAVMAVILALPGCAQRAPSGAPDGGATPSAPSSAAPATAASTAAPAASAGRPGPAAGPAEVRLQSTILGEQRTVLVRTPPGYQRGTARYPVLYLTDGAGQLPHTAATVEYLASHSRIPEMIVVGITHADRTRDLTPTTVKDSPTSGGADKFLEFIEKELVPHVEKTYRTHPYRVFAGHSLGGLFAVHALVQKPDLFQSLIAVAPTLGWDNRWVFKPFEALLAGRPELDRTLFVTLGDEPGEPTTSLEQLQAMATRKSPKGFRFSARRIPGEDHGSVVLLSHYAALRKIFDGWLMPDLPAGQPLTKALEAADAHYAALSKRFGFDITTPEQLLNELGYELLQANELDAAITAFQRNVERHPGSANVYDSLAEAYEDKGQLDLAITNYAKAAKVSEETDQANLGIFRQNLERATAKQKQGTASPN